MNPPTGEGGHKGIISVATDLFDEIWIEPVFVHRQHKELVEFNHRLEMAKLNFPGIKIRCDERKVATLFELPGTIDLLDMLVRNHPGKDFGLILGQDTFENLDQWKGGYEAVMKRCKAGVCVFTRTLSTLKIDDPRVQVKSLVYDVNVSSTKLRRAFVLKDNLILNDEVWVCPTVRDYSLHNNLY